MIANFLKNFRILLIFKPLHREDCTHAAEALLPLCNAYLKSHGKDWSSNSFFMIIF